ncbi:hypothetical protein ACKWTF_004116 [Chironomus riparius]
MTEDKKLIKFLSIPSKRTVKDFVATLCRQLNFTRTNYKEINGIFVENLQNNRYHLHVYPKSDEFKEGLKNAAKTTSDPHYLSIEINKTNSLFIMPPFNNSVYRVFPMERTCELFEKVIEFTTGIHQTIMDVLLIIDNHKYKILYIVCNRAKTYIAFHNGTDAMEMMELLRSQQYSPKFASCYAKVIYVDGNNRSQNINSPHNATRQSQNINVSQHQQRHNHHVARNAREHINAMQYDNNIIMARQNNTMRHGVIRRHNNVVRRFHPMQQQINVVQPYNNIPMRHFDYRGYHSIQRFGPGNMHRSYNRNNNNGGARFIRVMFPDNVQNNQYEMRLVRRF